MEKDSIKDEEFSLYLKNNYEQQVEEELLKTSYGKRIKALEKIGLGITVQEAVEKFCEKVGFSFDQIGNVKIEQDTISQIYIENINEISKAIGFDVSELDIQQITQVKSQIDEGQNAKDVKIDGITISKNSEKDINIDEIFEKLKIPETDYVLETKNMQRLLEGLGISKEKAVAHIKDYSKKVVDTYLVSKEDVGLISCLVYMRAAIENNVDVNANLGIDEFEAQIALYKNSKYWKEIVNEKGEIDFEKSMKFIKEFGEARDSKDLTNKLNFLLSQKKLSKENEKKLAEVIVRVAKNGNEVQIESAKMLAKKFGIDLIDADGRIDENKVFKYGKTVFGKDFSPNEILKSSTFKGEFALEELARIEVSIQNGFFTPNANVDEINEKNGEAKRFETRLCSKKEAVIFNILNAENAGNTRGWEFYSNPQNAKQLVLLFCKFREDEIKENNLKLNRQDKEFNENSINSCKNSNNASAILKKFMQEHKECFDEYLNSDGNLNTRKVMEIVRENKLDASRAANNLIAYERIKKETKKIEEVEVTNEKALKNMKLLLNKGKNEILSEDEKKKLYAAAAQMPVDILSTEMLEELKKMDEVAFQKAFSGKTVERNVGQNTWGAIYHSATKLFVKGVYALPKMIMDKNARKEYMPKIKKHIENGSKRISKKILPDEKNFNSSKSGILDKFKNLFSKKNNQNLLGAGTKEVLDKNNNNQKVETESTFNTRYSVDNTGNKVENEANKAASNSSNRENTNNKESEEQSNVEITQ